MKLSTLALASAALLTGPLALAQEGFVLQGKPSAQCSMHRCDTINGPSYAKDGSIVRPTGWEKWVFIGSPLTPDALNGGKANFREFHNVYIEPSAFDHYRMTGEFPNGTQIVKVRAMTYKGKDCQDTDAKTGACKAVSGWGYFNGEYSGFELTVKDTTRFSDPGGWVYLNYGETRPWSATAKPFPAGACNSCHNSAAADDFVFTQFYPVLRDNDPKRKLAAGGTSAATALMPKAEPRQMPAVASPVPTDEAKLYSYLQQGKYKSLSMHDPATHPSAGPHFVVGQHVKVYFSDAVAQSLKGGYDMHPKGSAIVKEIYSDNGKKLEGWAVSVKTDEASNGGKGWFWVEYTSTKDINAKPAPAGNGEAVCTSCHGTGKDYVLSSLPK